MVAREHRPPAEKGGRPSVWARLVVAALVAVALLSVHSWLSQWYDHTWLFVSAMGLVVALVLLADYVVVLVGPRVWRVVRSLAASAARGLADDPELHAFATRHPGFSAWLGRRFDTRSPKGLPLTAITVLAVWFFSGFVSIAKDVATATAITHLDPQVTALLRAFRTPVLTRLLWGFTVLGDTRVAVSLTVVAVVVALLWGLRREAALIVASVAGGSLLAALAKLLFHRARPSAALALIKSPESFSFPSGHAMYSMLLFGVLAVVLAVVVRGLRGRLAVFAGAALPVLLVGLSRVYLGVHWLSDVLASWMLALAWLSVTCGAYLMLRRFGREARAVPAGTLPVRITASVAALAVVVVAVSWGASRDPLLAAAAAEQPTKAWRVSYASDGLPAPTQAQAAVLPRFSEKLDGSHQEPIGLIYVGSESSLVSAFKDAGWQVADKPSIATLTRAIAAAISNSPYLNAPVTPTFLDGAVQDLAFERPQGSATVRRRHHTRWWKTHFTLGGQPVWVATQSFDSRLEIGSAIPLPTHHIEPDIDAEQRVIVGDLTRSGRMRLAAHVRVSTPMSGTDAQGDMWFTQGEAALLVPAP